MTSPHADRLARLQALMRETGTDLVAIGPSSHMMWLSGLDPYGDERPVMLLVGPDHAGFLMPALNAAAARKATDLPLHCWSDDEGPEAPRPGNVRDPEGLELHDLRQALGHQPLERAVFDVRGDGRVGEVLRLLPVEAVQVVDGVVAEELHGGGRRQ